MNPAVIQRRTLRLLFLTQVISGIGVAIGSSVGALLAAEIMGVGLSGLALSSLVLGSALLALPATAIVNRQGRRPSLAACYLLAAVGALMVVMAATRHSMLLIFTGFFLLGGASTANLQARYAAVDLAPAAVRGRQLSLVVWATTIGAIIGPSLAPLAGSSLNAYGIPTMAGPFVFSAGLFGVATLLLWLFLRPDPAVVARTMLGLTSGSPQPFRRSILAAERAVFSQEGSRLGVSAMAVGHVVMVGVMTMTPVHIRSAGLGAEHTLRVVGLVLSSHVAGMFAFSPVVGWLTDRLGRRPTILAGMVLLVIACALAGNAGHDPARLAIGMLVLGLGWSATMVAGSTLLSDSIAVELRPSAQGFSDLVMGLAGASAGAISGLILSVWGYGRLTLLAALATVPLVALILLSRNRIERTGMRASPNLD
jgi:MFS family permease